jgi:putative ABC transport system ATP-binding protein
LDRPTADHLAVTFREICHSQQLTVILVTHDLRLAEKIADYLVYLEGGRIREEGSAADLLSSPRSDELRHFLGSGTESDIGIHLFDEHTGLPEA